MISSEKKIIEHLISERKIGGIISDNRFGVRSKRVPSVYITHQLNILSGKTSFLSSKIHQNIIKKYDECWVPDFDENLNLSGKLGHLKNTGLNIKYIGVLSRMKKVKLPVKYDVLLLLSGPEPQRTLFEKLLIPEFKDKNLSVLLVKGCVEKKQKIEQQDSITIYNYMKTKELKQAINKSKIVVSRSGYTTIMDLATLEKKAFFIPTPGQFEQEYLAKRMKELQFAPFCSQEDFTIDKLKEVELYKGLMASRQEINFKKLFCLFESERKF